MNTQLRTRVCSDDQHWMFSACAIPQCCMHQVIPVHSFSSSKQPNMLSFLNGSLSVLGIILWCQVVRVVSSETVVVSSQPPETLHDRDYPFPPLCKTLSPSLLPVPISEQKIRIAPHPAQAPASLGSHSPPTFHPGSLRTDWSLRWMQGVMQKADPFSTPKYPKRSPGVMSLCWLLKPTNYT